MPSGNVVRPGKWSNVIDLYDDGTNSAIWGSYEQAPTRSLGMRWNNDYPSQGGNPLWYVEPDFLVKNILLELLSRTNKNPTIGNLTNILLALNEA